jgi:hypothetical protein
MAACLMLRMPALIFRSGVGGGVVAVTAEVNSGHSREDSFDGLFNLVSGFGQWTQFRVPRGFHPIPQKP